jgi:hypothetical protein
MIKTKFMVLNVAEVCVPSYFEVTEASSYMTLILPGLKSDKSLPASA